MLVTKMEYADLPDDVKDDMPENGPGAEWASYLKVDFGDGEVHYYSDAMESEDATFDRDLRWIKSALERAYYVGAGGPLVQEELGPPTRHIVRD